MEKVDLLAKGNLIIVIIFLLFLCCGRKEQKEDAKPNFYIEGGGTYNSKIFNQVNDTISLWINDSLEMIKSNCINEWQIDSLIIFNSDSSRLFTTINKRLTGFKNNVQDGIIELGGAKINGKWYFFFGASMVVGRELPDKLYEPLSFQKLSEIAHHYSFPKLNQDSLGKYHINEQFFIDNVMNPHVYGCYHCDTKEEIDSMIVAWCYNERQKKLDPAEIAQIKAEMAASRKPLEPRRTWFGFGKEYRKDDLENPRYPED